jgi:hypothetical protein
LRDCYRFLRGRYTKRQKPYRASSTALLQMIVQNFLQSHVSGNFVAYDPGSAPITRHFWTCVHHVARYPTRCFEGMSTAAAMIDWLSPVSNVLGAAMYLLRQDHSTDKILFSYALLGALCFGTFALLGDHNALAQDSGQCSSLQGAQASSALATLRMQTDRLVYRRDAPLEVTLTLKAGSSGVYLPAYFGDFMKTCEHGFSATLLTLAGKSADLHATGCMGGGLHSGPALTLRKPSLPISFALNRARCVHGIQH